MVSRYQSKRNLILIRALSKALVSYTDHPMHWPGLTHPWIRNYSRRLDLYNSLNEFDAAYSNPGSSSIPSFQDVRLYGGHLFPRWRVIGVVDADREAI